jgi:type IV fimbrial biogenesis protein FimT
MTVRRKPSIFGTLGATAVAPPRERPVPATCRGFSTVELIIVLTIAAVLMTAGAPSMGMFVRNSRLQAHTLDLMRTMHIARSEAVKRKTRVVLCRSANPAAASPTCGGTSYNWTTGFLVFASGDTNNTYEPAVDDLLARGSPVGNGINVITNGWSNNNLEYNSDGTTNEGGIARFAVCDSRGGAHGLQIDVTPVGRPRIRAGTPSSTVNCTGPT